VLSFKGEIHGKPLTGSKHVAAALDLANRQSGNYSFFSPGIRSDELVIKRRQNFQTYVQPIGGCFKGGICNAKLVYLAKVL